MGCQVTQTRTGRGRLKGKKERRSLMGKTKEGKLGGARMVTAHGHYPVLISEILFLWWVGYGEKT